MNYDALALDEIQRLRQQLAECQKDGRHYAHEYLIAKDALAECERERDSNNRQASSFFIENSRLNTACVNLEEQLATVTSERDELVAALRDMMNTLTDGHDDSDVYRVFDKARAALAKLGADKGEVE
jgi:chromosome segregation ATPase